MRAWVIGAALALTGCIDSQLTLCGDGTACPASLACDLAHHSCIAPDQLAARTGISAGGACQTSELSGTCRMSMRGKRRCTTATEATSC